MDRAAAVPLIALAAAWTAWCVLHSQLAVGPLRRAAERALGRRAYLYRVLYNLVALASLVPVLWLARSVDGPVIFGWWGADIPVSAVLLIVSLVLFAAGSRAYDMDTFLGLRQLREHAPVRDGTKTAAGPVPSRDDVGLTAGGGLSRSGILGVVRHPWYTAGILILWAGPKNAAALVTAAVLSVYLVVGAHLEERRLLEEFGDRYRRYRAEVSMFLPFRWIRRRVAGRP